MQLPFPLQLFLAAEICLSFSGFSTQAAAPTAAPLVIGSPVGVTEQSSPQAPRKPVGNKLRASDPYIFAARGDPKKPSRKQRLRERPVQSSRPQTD